MKVGQQSINQMLSNYKIMPNHCIVDTIDNGNFDEFTRILNNSNGIDTEGLMHIILNRLFNIDNNSNINASKFLEYIVDNNGKYEWNIKDYTIAIAYCAQKSDFNLLSKIMNNVDKSKYNLNMKFKTVKNGRSSKWVPEIVKWSESANKERMKTKTYVSILDFCIRSRFPHCNKKVNYTAHNFDINVKKNQDIINLMNDKNNDNYKCFELLVKKTKKILNGRSHGNGYDAVLIYDCYENLKNSFVECLISNNICKDYSCILIHCCKYPQTWKLGSLNMLLNDYTFKERSYNLFCGDYQLKQFMDKALNPGGHSRNNVAAAGYRMMNCLHWCVNIGMQPLWAKVYMKKDSRDDIPPPFYDRDEDDEYLSSNRHWWNDVLNYNSDSSGAAFECFRLIVECKNISSENVNSLLNLKMRDDMHLIDICMANSLVNNKFIDYLIKSNSKYEWIIDMRTTNWLRLACLIGNYKIVHSVLNRESRKNLAHLVSESEVIKPILNPKWTIQELHFEFTSSNMNDFAAINNFKMISNNTKIQTKLKNLLCWCINCKREIVVNTDNNNDSILNLDSHQRKLLCLGYLRNGGYDNNVSNIEYPDNISTILNRYLDWEFGNIQCFKFLLNNCVVNNNVSASDKGIMLNDSVEDVEDSKEVETLGVANVLYPRIVYDCIVHKRTEILRILVEKCKKDNYQLKTTDGNNIYQWLRYLFGFVCFMANSSMLKYVLSLFENEKNFDINASIDSIGCNELTYDAVTEMSIDPVISKIFRATPLFAVAMAQTSVGKETKYDIIKKQEELECIKILLSHSDIDPHKKCMNKTLFIHCIENNKIDLIEYMYNLAFNNDINVDNYNNKYKFDFRTIPSDGIYLNCLDIPIRSGNIKMFKFLLKNIIKYKIFTNDEINGVCQGMLSIIVERAAEDSWKRKEHFQIFKHLLSDKQLIKNKKLNQRFAVITKDIIDVCVTNKLVVFLRYMMDNWLFLSTTAVKSANKYCVDNNKFNQAQNRKKIQQCVDQEKKKIKKKKFDQSSRIRKKIIRDFGDSGSDNGSDIVFDIDNLDLGKGLGFRRSVSDSGSVSAASTDSYRS